MASHAPQDQEEPSPALSTPPDPEEASLSTPSETSLDDLLVELLRGILHASGPHTRRVCRHWRATYGPPAAGLLVTNVLTEHDLANPPPTAPFISTLAIARGSYETTQWGHPRCRPSIIGGLPRAFPRLRSLDLDVHMVAQPVAENIPFPPTLTALTLRNPHAISTFPPSLLPLHSLALVGIPADPSTLNAVSSLTNLRALEVKHPPNYQACSPSPAQEVLTPLAALSPTLTHLDISLLWMAADPASLRALDAVPRSLRSLHLNIILPDDDDPSADACLSVFTSILASRDALTTLHLSLMVGSHYTTQAVRHLTPLHSLTALSLDLTDTSADFADQHQVQPPETEAAVFSQLQPHATQAAIISRLQPPEPETEAAIVSRLKSLQSLSLAAWGFTDWQPPLPVFRLVLSAAAVTKLRLTCSVPSYHTLAGLRQLTAVRSLNLTSNVDRACQPDPAAMAEATRALLALTQLTYLNFRPEHEEFSRAVLGGISVLRSLRHLYAWAGKNDGALAALSAASTTLDRLEFSCCGYRSCTKLRPLRDLPGSIRCLVLQGCKSACRLPMMLSHTVAWKERHAVLGRMLCEEVLPLPAGVRLLVLEGLQPKDVPNKFWQALEAAARAQDCEVRSWKPEDDRHNGRNGYRA